MPDLPNREDEEKELAALLLILFVKFKADAIRQLGSPPDIRRIPESYWLAMEAELRTAVEPTLERIHRESGERMALMLGLIGLFLADRANAYSWASQQSAFLARGLTGRIRTAMETTVDRLVARAGAENAAAAAAFEEASQAAAAAGDEALMEAANAALRAAAAETQDQLQAELLAALDEILSEARAERIAITEITGAVSAGEFDQRDTLEDLLGVEITAVWNIRDNDACKICKAEAGKPEEEWIERYPNGPGYDVHAECRCFLTWEIVA